MPGGRKMMQKKGREVLVTLPQHPHRFSREVFMRLEEEGRKGDLKKYSRKGRGAGLGGGRKRPSLSSTIQISAVRMCSAAPRMVAEGAF